MIDAQLMVNGNVFTEVKVPVLPRAGELLVFSKASEVYLRFRVDQVAHMIDEQGDTKCGLFCTQL